jgi:hypothetical protein
MFIVGKSYALIFFVGKSSHVISGLVGEVPECFLALSATSMPGASGRRDTHRPLQGCGLVWGAGGDPWDP